MSHRELYLNNFIPILPYTEDLVFKKVS